MDVLLSTKPTVLEKKVYNDGGKKSIAKAISNPYPPGGNIVLDLLENFDGLGESVSDEEILSAQHDIAKEGIYCQPSSTVGPAVAKKLVKRGKIEKGSEVVSIVTGSGLKTIGPPQWKSDICEL